MWPLIIYLHASNLQGHDLSRIGTPIPPDVDEIRNNFPFVVLTPQCPAEYDAWPSDIVVDLIDEMVKLYNVDARRVYVTGFSLGGRGSWSVAVDHPELFAAIGTAWGSPSSKRFNLPDLRGLFLRGVDAGSGRDPDVNKRQASKPGGNDIGVGSVQDDSVQNMEMQLPA